VGLLWEVALPVGSAAPAAEIVGRMEPGKLVARTLAAPFLPREDPGPPALLFGPAKSLVAVDETCIGAPTA
jgi:hypothetical protein